MNTESRTKIDYIAELLRIIQQTPSFTAFSLPFPSIWCSVHTGPQPRSAISSWFDLLPPSPPHPSHRPFPLPFQLVLLRSSLSPGPSYLLPITAVLRSLICWQKVFQYLSNEAKLPRANPDLYPRRRRPRGLANIAVTSKPCARRDGSVTVDRATDIFVRRIPGNLIRKREFWSLAICCDSP